MIGRRIPQEIFKRNPSQTLSGIMQMPRRLDRKIAPMFRRSIGGSVVLRLVHYFLAPNTFRRSRRWGIAVLPMAFGPDADS